MQCRRRLDAWSSGAPPAPPRLPPPAPRPYLPFGSCPHQPHETTNQFLVNYPRRGVRTSCLARARGLGDWCQVRLDVPDGTIRLPHPRPQQSRRRRRAGPAGRPRPDRPHRRPPDRRRRPGAVAQAAHPGHRWPHCAGCRPSEAAHRPGPRVCTGRAAGGQDPHPRHHHLGSHQPGRYTQADLTWPRTWPGGPPPPSSTPTEPTIPTHPHQPPSRS